jgi:hypothetical protein
MSLRMLIILNVGTDGDAQRESNKNRLHPMNEGWSLILSEIQ